MNAVLEDLEINGYKIYQDKDSFQFGMDAVLLANFAIRELGAKKLDRLNYELVDKVNLCDLCSGNGVIPFIMYAKTVGINIDESCDKKQDMLKDGQLECVTFEINNEQTELAKKSIAYNTNLEKIKQENTINNGMNTKISVVNDDLNNIIRDREKYKSLYNTFDMVTCNPPYIKKGHGVVNVNDKKLIARHEITVTFDEICKASNILLKTNKKFVFVHEPKRLMELSKTLRANAFEIKKLQFIHTKVDKQAILVLVSAVKGGKEGVEVLEPVVIYENDGITYTQKTLEIYGK